MKDLKQIQEFFSKPLNEGEQLDIIDLAKVVQAVTKTGHPATILLVPKFNEIEIITGMDAPDDMLRDLSDAVDSLGYGRNDIIIAGDSSNLSRREYSDIRRVNGGHKDYFQESLNENKDPIEVKYFKRGDTYFQILVKYERPVGFLRALGRQTAFGQQIDQNEAAAQERVKTIVNDLKSDFDLDEIFVETGQVAGRYYINAFSDDFIDMDANDLEGFYILEEATKEEEGTSIELRPVGRDTGVKLNLRDIKKHLEKNGYTVNYSKGSSMVNPKVIDVFNPNTGNSIVIARNGELFGDGNWGVEVSTDKEAIQALKQFENELNESKPLKENTFKVGQKVTYLGHPAVVTATKEYNGRNFVSVSYDKGTGKTKASDILATSGDVKPVNEEVGELESIKTRLEADPKNEYLNFIHEPERDQIRVGGREGAKQDFVLRNEKEDFGSYELFDIEDDDRGLIVHISRKK